MKATFKKTVIGVAVAAAMGVSASASATVYDFSYTGAFTMLDSGGGFMQNTSNVVYNAVTNPYSGYRTLISGTMQFDTATGQGSGTVVPFNFFKGSLPAEAVGISMQAIGDGNCTATGCGAGTLVLGNMLFNWNGTYGIPVSIVLDAQGMFAAVQGAGSAGLTMGQTIDGTYGTFGASEVVMVPAPKGGTSYALPMGKQAVSTTGWNTSLNGAAALNNAAIGTLPLIADTIGGSPMLTTPFGGSNANFDIATLTVTGVTNAAVVPVPAAAWLLGSGLLGLVGVARRRKEVA